jgi:hypothetical protein
MDLSKSVITTAELAKFRQIRDLLKSKYFAPGLKREYYHWTVAPHGVTFPDYNLEVVYRDGGYDIVITGNPQDNAPGFNNNPVHSHTWHRNTGAVGISIDGMDGAEVHNFGKDAPTETELIYLCGAGAAVAAAYDIDANGAVSEGETHIDNNGKTINTKGERNILTHGECAVIDAYPTERWDLGCLEALPEGEELTPAIRTASGDQLRALTHRIKAML